MTARRKIPLDGVVKLGERIIDRPSFEADPDNPDHGIRGVLLASMWAKHRRRAPSLPNYSIEVWRPGIDRDPRSPWKTYRFAKAAK